MDDPSDIWRDVSSRIGFYTKETSHQIPETAGTYGWFVPLWMYSTDLDELLGLVRTLLNYEPKVESEGPPNVVAEFNWVNVSLEVDKRPEEAITDSVRTAWQEMLDNEKAREGFQRAMMEATIFLPPLYVGKTDNLRVRYRQHISRRSSSGSATGSFRARFNHFVDKANIGLEPDDLLFVCIQTNAETSERFRAYGLNQLLEKLLMRLASPPFSVK